MISRPSGISAMDASGTWWRRDSTIQKLEAHVLRAAAALGLRGTNPPAYRDYDAVIILGGLVRACLARPSHAARLVEQNVITTHRVRSVATAPFAATR